MVSIRSTIERLVFRGLCALLLLFPVGVQAQKSAIPSASPTLTYADMADLALAARFTVAVRVRKAERIKGPSAVSAVAGRKRFLATSEVLALIRGTDSILPRITYLVDVGPDARGKMPKLTKGEHLVFANAVPGFPGEVRLVSPDAHVPATPDTLALARSILKEAASPDAPPAVTGVSSAFHAPGSIPGEGETQMFLETKEARPVSISVVRTLGARPRWFVSLGEVVDQAARPPQRNTLAWYRLACFLPVELPADILAETEPELAAIVREDYATVRAGLGRCPRTLSYRPGT
jgi:hypothetical protein